MYYAAIALSAILLLGAAEIGSADRSFSNIKSGKMSVNFNSGSDGLSINYDGVALIRNSTMWIHNPAWTYHYYGLPHMKDPVKVIDSGDVKEAVVTHRSQWFEGSHRISVRENQVKVELSYKLTQDVSDAGMEYCFGNICAAPILGRPFRAVTVSGAGREGTVPVRATERGLDKTLLVPEPFKKLEIDSRIGRITFEVTGDPAGMCMFDNRLSPYEEDDATPVFWSGILGTHLEFGKEYVHTVTLSVEPAAGPRKSIEPISGKAAAHPKTELRAPNSAPVYVIPEPQEMTLADGDFALTSRTMIVVGDGAGPEDLRGAKSFAEEMGLLHGIRPRIVRESQAGRGGSAILVGEVAANRLLAAAALEQGIAAPAKDEGYALKVTPKQVLVLGYDRRGSYYGMQTLKQLAKVNGKQTVLQGCTISDWPSLKFRGVHLFTGNEALPFHKKLIDRIFSRFKANHLILEIDQIKWKADPELAVSFSMDQEDVKKEIAYAEDHFIEVSPLLQSLGHCDWMFTNGKNLDLAENPEKPYSYCPTNPRTYDYVRRFYDEAVELFNKPRFFHIGHDEVVEPGGFPKHEECRKRSAEQIFVDDTLIWHEHLKEHGARVMMWGDMMLARGDSPDATNAKNQEMAKWMRDKLPKDIIITDWHYAPGKPEEFKSIGIFTEEGHDTIASTWFTPANIEAFSKQAKNVGALGLLQTTWAGFNSNENCLKHSFNQFSAMVLAAEYAWNSGKTDLDRLPYKWDEEFRRQWDPRPVERGARRGFVLDLSPVYNISLADTESSAGWLGLGARHDLSEAPTGEIRLSGDLFRMAGDNSAASALRLASSLDMEARFPQRAEIQVGRKAASLLFMHTTLWTDRSGRQVGAYRMHYADGAIEEMPLVYGVNTCSWIDQRSVNGATRIWQGRTRDDQRVVLHRAQWDNPRPDKEISRIEFISLRTEAGPVLLAVSGIE